MKAKFINENISDILKPKSKEEILKAEERVYYIINKIHDQFVEDGRDDIFDINYKLSNDGIIIMFEFENYISLEEVEGILFGYDFFDLEVIENNILNIKIPQKYLNESIGGAGFAVYGGGWGGRGFGNPSISVGGRNFGRGFGFGSSQNLGGGPNLMYTYSIKPLNQYLQQPMTPQDDEQYIHVGSKIKGFTLNSNKEIEGQIIYIEKNSEGDIKWYIVLDKKGKKQKVNPTTSYLIEPDPFIDPNLIPTELKEEISSNIKNRFKHKKSSLAENFYPTFEYLNLRPKSEDEIFKDLKKLSLKEMNNLLINAAFNGQKDVVELLVKAGADINAKTNYGTSVLILAARYGYKDIVKLLKRYGAKE